MFDEKYYDTIYPGQGLHRHDYAETIANSLVNKYGQARILDIGAGCGELVRILRERGCEAWGLEISDYAVKNSCIPQYIRFGDVSNIPFPAGMFDVVFSHGLWCHVREEAINKAWQECQRVGMQQEHVIDYEDAPLEIPYFFTRKSEAWWKNKFYPKVLVACPTHEVKEYAMAEWLAAIQALDYPNYDILLVDNSPTDALYERWKDKVPLIHLPDTDQAENASSRINASMTVIKEHFLKGEYTWWLNVEIDVIIPPETLKTLLQFPSDWTSHDYEVRGGGGRMTGIGCSLLSRSIAEAGVFTSSVHGADAELWTQTMNTHRTQTLTNWLPIKHIGKGNGYGG
jgi:ubiquinone/menaquinone biosynthesis C-methylase UbiE